MRQTATAWALCVLVLSPLAAQGHSRSVSHSIWRVEGHRVHLYVELDPRDVLESVLVDVDRDGEMSAAEGRAGAPRIASLLEGTVEVRESGEACPADGEVEVEIPDPPERVYLRHSFACARAVTALRAGLHLDEVVRQSAHKNLANFRLPHDRLQDWQRCVAARRARRADIQFGSC